MAGGQRFTGRRTDGSSGELSVPYVNTGHHKLGSIGGGGGVSAAFREAGITLTSLTPFEETLDSEGQDVENRLGETALQERVNS